MNGGDAAAILVTTILTLAVTTVLIVRMRTSAHPTVGSAELREIVERLERMEQAIDAVAVETERISEGQRFTTKLLSERTKDHAEGR